LASKPSPRLNIGWLPPWGRLTMSLSGRRTTLCGSSVWPAEAAAGSAEIGATRAFRVAVFRSLDPNCPAGERYCAHAFDRNGRLKVATQLGPSEACGEALAAFLDDEIARVDALRSRRTPERMSAIRAGRNER
jgi:hypothetical protein